MSKTTQPTSSTAPEVQDMKDINESDPDLSGLRVMVVEDDVLIAMDIEYALEDTGATVIGPIGTLPDGVEVARTQTIDCAILDIDLAGADVYPVADILNERAIPFIFHTGHGERSELSSAYPGIAVCQKPCRMDQLISQVSAVAATDT